METVLITGANRGIGAELHAQARAAGHRVIGTTRQTPGAADWHTLEVTERASQAALAAALEGVTLDLLVCNAGIYADKGLALEDYTGAEMTTSFDVNVTGVLLTVQALLPRMAAGGRIAVISSQMGSSARAPGGSYAYRASKAAATNLAMNLATDLAPRGIYVGAYHPGWVQTDMGGASAQTTPAESARGLLTRFAALGPNHTGIFETFEGQIHAF
ncbi:MAG: SDR family NAD(P)-dependent oxidoreductase [Pseudomonadota bacterium]